MYFDHEQTLEWASRIAGLVAANADRIDAVELVVFPDFASLAAVRRVFAGGPTRLGAQNLSEHDAGAFTGEVSARTLAQVGCQYAEIGHAERRRLFGEGDLQIEGKLNAAFGQGLIPLLCVGEPAEGPPDAAASHCSRQLEATLGKIGAAHAGRPAVVAYEPVWAIGAERPAAPEHIARVCGSLRRWLSRRRPAASSLVVYGGSAGPGLLTRLGASVDGLFLGRLAHDPAAFAAILAEALRGGGSPDGRPPDGRPPGAS
jgi:triosephosphate isomerase